MQRALPYILLADDDPDDQETFVEAFNRLHPNVAVATVNNGNELFEFLAACDSNSLPVLILIDYNMPIVTGPEVLQRLADQSAYSSIVKLVWSTSQRSVDKEQCKRLGAADYFRKPATFKERDELLEQINKIFVAQLQNQPID